MKRAFVLFLCAAALLGLVACGGVPATREAVFKKLYRYLPEEVWGLIAEFKEGAAEGGGTQYAWSETISTGGMSFTAQEIKYEFNERGLTYYSYAYFGVPPPERRAPLTAPKARKLAERFARDFITGGEKMPLESAPEASTEIFCSDQVTFWQGGYAGKTYVIAVDPLYGHIVEVTSAPAPAAG